MGCERSSSVIFGARGAPALRVTPDSTAHGAELMAVPKFIYSKSQESHGKHPRENKDEGSRVSPASAAVCAPRAIAASSPPRTDDCHRLRRFF